MQSKEETSSGLELYMQYSEGAAQFLTPQCARSIDGIVSLTGEQVNAVQSSRGV